jgi:hypothetical protein
MAESKLCLSRQDLARKSMIWQYCSAEQILFCLALFLLSFRSGKQRAERESRKRSEWENDRHMNAIGLIVPRLVSDSFSFLLVGLF